MRALRAWTVATMAVAVWMALGTGIARAGTAASISAVEGQPLTGVVVDTVPSCSPGRLSNVTIDWGDGSSSNNPPVTQGSGGTCVISGSHTYAEEGSDATSVSYTFGGAKNDTGAATVADAPVAATPVSNMTASAGTQLTGVVARWSDPAPEATSSYSATIDWGDGTTSAGAIGPGAVSGAHTYANGGRFTISVTFRDEGGASATAQEHAFVTGCPSAAPGSPAPPFTPTAAGLTARYVQAIYHDILGRAAAPPEIAAATAALSAGATRSQIAVTLLGSAEYRAGLVASRYAAYLRRAPNASETNTFLTFLASNTDEALAAQILGSPEYLASRGGNSTDGFLSGLYCDALAQPIDPLAQNFDETALGSGVPRTAIAASVLGSATYRSLLIRSLYLHYLRRAATSGEIATWTAFMHGGGTDEQVIASLVSSAEYFADVNPAPALTRLIVHGSALTATLTQPATLILTVYRVLPFGHAAAVLVKLPHTKLVGSVGFGRHRKGRVTLRWNRKVNGHPLGGGRYLLILEAFKGHKPYHKPWKTRQLVGLGNPVRIRIR